MEKVQKSLEMSEELVIKRGLEIRDLEKDKSERQTLIEELEDQNAKLKSTVDHEITLGNEREENMHEKHHGGAGSTALMIAHDAFLPESMGSSQGERKSILHHEVSHFFSAFDNTSVRFVLL